MATLQTTKLIIQSQLCKRMHFIEQICPYSWFKIVYFYSNNFKSYYHLCNFSSFQITL